MNQLQTKMTHLPIQDWNSLRSMADAFIRSGYAPSSVKTPEQAVIIAVSGKELGVPFMASMRSINVIQGKPCASVQLKLALAMNTGELEDFKIERKDDGVLVTVKRKGFSPMTMPFGTKEAKAMKLVGRDNYEKQPMTMYQWRALGAVLDIIFADVLLGMTTNYENMNEHDLLNSQIVETAPVTSNAPQPTAVQEVIESNNKYQEEKKETESGSNSKEVGDLLQHIKDMLAQMNDGVEDAMNEHLKSLTTWTDKDTGNTKFVELSGLEKIKKSRPTWLVVIHSKVKRAFDNYQIEHNG